MGVKCPSRASVCNLKSGVWRGGQQINQCFTKINCALMLVKCLICASVYKWILIGWVRGGWVSGQPATINLCFTSSFCDLIGVKFPTLASVSNRQSTLELVVNFQSALRLLCCSVFKCWRFGYAPIHYSVICWTVSMFEYIVVVIDVMRSMCRVCTLSPWSAIGWAGGQESIITFCWRSLVCCNQIIITYLSLSMTVNTVDLSVITHPFRNKTLVFKQFSNYVRCLNL